MGTRSRRIAGYPSVFGRQFLDATSPDYVKSLSFPEFSNDVRLARGRAESSRSLRRCRTTHYRRMKLNLKRKLVAFRRQSTSFFAAVFDLAGARFGVRRRFVMQGSGRVFEAG